MSSSYSTSLRVELIGDGDQAGTWGTTTDNNFAYIFDAAIAGYQTVSVTAANQALTYVNGPTSTVALNQSVYAMLRFTTTTGAAFSVFAPPVPKTYIIYNDSGYTATIYNSTVIGNTTAAGSSYVNRDFLGARLDPQEVGSLLQLYTAGTITQETLLNQLSLGEILGDEFDVDAELEATANAGL